MSTYLILTLIATFAAIVLGVYGMAALFDPYWLAMRRRVQCLANSDNEDENSGAPPISSLLRRLVDSAVDQDLDRDYLIARFAQAGVYRPAAVSWYFSAKLALVVLPILIGLSAYGAGLLHWDAAIIGGLLVASLGSLAPNIWLGRMVQQRHCNLRKALPDLLDLMIVCLEGGMSLSETLRRVADELRIAHPDLAVELGMVQRDIELGSTIDQALRRFARRANFEGVRTLSTFVRETQRFGTRLTEALRGHADLLRSQREQAAEELAQKASVKILLPTLLMILPAVFVVLVGPAVIQIQQCFGGDRP